MTSLISYKPFSSTQLKKVIPRVKSNVRHSIIQISALNPTLGGKRFCLMSLFPYPTTSWGSLLNPSFLSLRVGKGFFHTDLAKTDRRGKSLRGKSLSVQSSLQGVVLESNADRSFPREGRGIDHRLLTSKLGGWRHQPSVGEIPPQRPPHGKVVDAHRQKVSSPLPLALLRLRSKRSKRSNLPASKGDVRALPSYLVKVVNQLMHHGKKGASVGLLADSLTLFCKRLEEERRSHLQNGGARSRNLVKKGNVQGSRISTPLDGKVDSRLPLEGMAERDSGSDRRGCIPLERSHQKLMQASQPEPVPSFPFHFPSFPGRASGEILPLLAVRSKQSKESKERERRGGVGAHPVQLLVFPFSGSLSPRLPATTLYSVKRGGEHRGLVGLEALQEVTLQSKGLLLTKTRSPNGLQGVDEGKGLRRSQRPALGWRAVEALASHASLASHAEQISACEASSSDLRAEEGLRLQTKRPLYFWPIKEPAALPSHSKGISSKGGLPPRRLSSPRVISHRAASAATQKSEASIRYYLGLAISNIEPSLEVRKKKIAGITRQIPCLVPKGRGERLAIRWIINSAREKVRKRGKGLPYCLADELVDAYYKRGEPRQKRDSLHKTAESNRSFLRYRWW